MPAAGYAADLRWRWSALFVPRGCGCDCQTLAANLRQVEQPHTHPPLTWAVLQFYVVSCPSIDFQLQEVEFCLIEVGWKCDEETRFTGYDSGVVEALQHHIGKYPKCVTFHSTPPCD